MRQSSTVTFRHDLGQQSWQNRGVENLDELVRRRVLALYDRVGKSGDKWTAEKLMPFLGMTVPSGVRKLLNGTNKISLAHLQAFCEAFAITPCELLAQDGAEFVYLKDAEPALIRLYREMDSHERLSLITVLSWRPPRFAEKRKAQLGRRELSTKEQELVDLFARVKKEGVREGVLRTLRGAADDAATAQNSRTTG